MVLTLALAVSGGGDLLSAQQGRGVRGLGLNGFGPRLGENVVLALELQGELGLSPEQVGSLQSLQAGIQEDVQPLEGEIFGLRSGISAGEVAYADGLARLQELFGEYEKAAAPYRTEMQGILTPVQHQTLQGIMWESGIAQGRNLGGVGLRRGLNPVPGVVAGQGVGRGAGLGLGRGVGLGVGRAGGLNLDRGAGLSRGLGRMGGRGMGVRRWR